MTNVDPGLEGTPPAPPPATPPATPPAQARGADGKFAQPAAPATVTATPPGTVAAGAAPPPPEKPYWPEDWRTKAAEAIATDDKGRAKALKRLERLNDPTLLAVKAFNLEDKLASGLVKVPGPKSTDEEKAEWREAIGVPKDATGYLDKLTLGDGKVLGEADRPIAEAFAKAMHGYDATPAQVSGAVNWYLQHQEEMAANEYKQDRVHYNETQAALSKEWGPAKDVNLGVIASLFANAPGGADADNPDSFMSQILLARLPNGRLLGDSLEFNKWASNLAREINPAATIVTNGADAGRTVQSRIEEIEKTMRTDRRKYDKDAELQAELRRLYDAREKMRGRAAA